MNGGCPVPLSGGMTEPKGAVLAQPARCRQRLPKAPAAYGSLVKAAGRLSSARGYAAAMPSLTVECPSAVGMGDEWATRRPGFTAVLVSPGMLGLPGAGGDHAV